MLADKRIGTTINGLKKSQHKNLFFNLKQFNALLELCYDFVELYCNLPKRSKSSNLLPLQLLYIYIYIYSYWYLCHTLCQCHWLLHLLVLLHNPPAPSSSDVIEQPLAPTSARVIEQLCLCILWRFVCHQPWHEKSILRFAFYLLELN